MHVEAVLSSHLVAYVRRRATYVNERSDYHVGMFLCISVQHQQSYRPVSPLGRGDVTSTTASKAAAALFHTSHM